MLESHEDEYIPTDQISLYDSMVDQEVAKILEREDNEDHRNLDSEMKIIEWHQEDTETWMAIYRPKSNFSASKNKMNKLPIG